MNNNTYDIVILGGGVAGMNAAINAATAGLSTVIIEKEASLGGHLKGLNRLFPEDYSAEELLERLRKAVADTPTEVVLNCEVTNIDPQTHCVATKTGTTFRGKTLIIATGYELFDAALKQEYGYQIFDNVVTSYEFEQIIKSGSIRTTDGKIPEKIAFLHCVGSRDEKVMQNHCSKVCCVTAVRQAINARQLLPQCKVYNFYMDIRMFGAGYEEMYRTAQQEYQIHFIRGRVSEASPTINNSIVLKAEDTLIVRPIKLEVDLLVLAIGMCPNAGITEIAHQKGFELYKSGFLKPVNSIDFSTYSNHEGIFYAGCAAAPKNIMESMNDAAQAVFAAKKYLNTK